MQTNWWHVSQNILRYWFLGFWFYLMLQKRKRSALLLSEWMGAAIRFSDVGGNSAHHIQSIFLPHSMTTPAEHFCTITLQLILCREVFKEVINKTDCIPGEDAGHCHPNCFCTEPWEVRPFPSKQLFYWAVGQQYITKKEACIMHFVWFWHTGTTCHFLLTYTTAELFNGTSCEIN